jgi:hypothetical protein
MLFGIAERLSLFVSLIDERKEQNKIRHLGKKKNFLCFVKEMPMNTGNLLDLNMVLTGQIERINEDAVRESFHVWEDGKLKGDFVQFVSEYIEDYWTNLTGRN